MPNPRYVKDGRATREVIFKLNLAHYIYMSELEPFCRGFGYEHDLQNLKNVEGIFLIGSHANDNGWSNKTSDIDFKLVIPKMLPAAFDEYKRKILDSKLHIGKKPDWIDLFAVNEKYKVDPPYFDLTSIWHSF